jgi:hypothetical protein
VNSESGKHFTYLLSDYIFVVITFCVSVYAIAITSLNTVLLPIPIFSFIYLFYKSQHKKFSNFNINYFYLILTTLALTLIYTCNTLFNFDDNYIRYLSWDSYYSSKIADFIYKYQKETWQTNYFFPENANIEPYHYFEIWLCSLISNLFSLRTDIVLITIVYPLFILLGNIAIYESFINYINPKYKFQYILLIAITPYFMGLRFLFPTFLFEPDIYSMSIIGENKHAVVYYFISILILNFSNKNYIRLFTTFCIISIAFVGMLPSILLFSLLLILYLIYKKSNIILPSFLLLFNIIYIPTYYHLNRSTDYVPKLLNISIENIKTSINIIGGGVFQFTIISIFIFIIFYYYNKNKGLQIHKKSFEITLFLILISFLGLISWGATHILHVDSVQFYTNLLIPSFSIIILLSLLVFILSDKFKFFRIFIIIYIAFTIYFNFDDTHEYQDLKRNDYNKLKVFLNGYDGYFVGQNNNIESPLLAFPFFDYNTQFMSTIIHPYIYLNISSDYSVDDNADSYLINELLNHPYYRYSQINNFENNLEPKFIKEFKIEYFIQNENSILPAILNDFIIDSLVLENNNTIYKIDLEKIP